MKIFIPTSLFVPVLSMVYPFELDPRVMTEIQDWEADNRCDMKLLVRLGAEKSQSEGGNETSQYENRRFPHLQRSVRFDRVRGRAQGEEGSHAL